MTSLIETTSYEGVRALVENLVKKHTLGEEIPKEYDAISEEAIETFYSTAYHFYNNGKYNDALVIFRLLTVLDPMSKRFWMGLAASQQLEKMFGDAMASYGFAALLDDEDPLPHLHAADCAMNLGNLEEAREALLCSKIRALDEGLCNHIALLKERWFGINDDNS
ncbi:MAG: SycD/LcrH family type III secretion system chaperone [Waddliaceae bacterium]|nr:SycD/LcrH family type III secretion system chaperone [Waddliaceae bacterium]